jgi:peptidoglycan/LPS O-acetylase OafA/YrhL
LEKLRITYWNPKIEGLRGFSILLVFAAHLFGKNSHNWGALGVAIFFVISGYVITGSITRQVITQNTDQVRLISFLKVFYIRRGKRLLPLAIAVILSVYLISLFDPNSDNKQYFLSAIFCLLYIGNLFGFTFGYTDLAPALGHFWSLAVEEQFYFIWPILFFVAIKKIKRKSTLVYFLALMIGLVQLSHPLIHLMNKTVWTLPTTYFDLLLLGCLLNLVSKEVNDLVSSKLRGVRVVGIVSLCLIIFGTRFPESGVISFFQYNSNFLLAGLVFIFALNSRVFENPLLMYFGKVSYSLYCIHWPVIHFSYTFIGDSLVTMVFAAVLSTLLSDLSHKHFESRFYKASLGTKVGAHS